MPVILLELVELLANIKEADTFAEAFEVFGKKVFGTKYTKMENAIKGLTPAENETFRKKVGDKVHDSIHKSLKSKDKTSIKVDTPESSWVESIEWNRTLSIGTLKVKGNDKIYKLPFFPRSIVTSIQNGASAGKTIWRRYWRVFGKGKVSNKLKNKLRVDTTKKAVKLINVAVPTLKMPKKGKKGTFKKNLVKKVTIKTSNTPKTGAKGVTIRIKTPGIRKY